MRRVWFWAPCWYWHGWRTLLPWYVGGDEYGRRTLLLGWTVTGRVIVAVSRPGRLYPPDADLVSDWGCCALDRDGTGHDGPCGHKCITCLGTGQCPMCDGDGPELCGCRMCDTTGTCLDCWGEGWISEEVA